MESKAKQSKAGEKEEGLKQEEAVNWKIKRECERETNQTMLSFSSPSYTCRRLIKSPFDLPLELRP